MFSNMMASRFKPGQKNELRTAENGLANSTIPPPTSSGQPTLVSTNDQLTAFRHMVGIHSTSCLASDANNNHLHFEGRPAPNLGIYNRVVHREQAAKKGFKWASFLINGALGVQVIVAAALTAMGAASSNHVGITAFGAINTVIAGLLTYLKGSGLPNRLRFYENEWKKVREYIEQRERDFSRPDCRLNVQEVVDAIEIMYEEVKADVESNTPDNYISVGDMKKRRGFTNPDIPKLPEVTGTAKRLKSLEEKYGPKVFEFIEGFAKKEEEKLKEISSVIERDIDSEKSHLERKEKEMEHGLGAKLRELKEDFQRRKEEYEREVNNGLGGVRNNLNSVKSGMDAYRQNMEKEIGTTMRDVERTASNTKSGVEMEIEEHRRNYERGVDAGVRGAHQSVDAIKSDLEKSLDDHQRRYESQVVAGIKTAHDDANTLQSSVHEREQAYQRDVANRVSGMGENINVAMSDAARGEQEVYNELRQRAEHLSNVERSLGTGAELHNTTSKDENQPVEGRNRP
ncbi:hypothetical protein BU24DRAFT_491026 [Aaosphaeria arxii CBS 175.79]|uniref:SMODS and SLOG-associating 2TM effector domain-containing protein n=1 Tax=Aaosphaeria arxii CBS 175.79 TaxID=1450172 RepID=A0A6A5XXB5_9PLEO|nr:uncharacterized protein BU24DRAFT_491026 [Aaosphaeria arxii CBS 175.79]KAF2017958.1 hypothetical protein BU24DRAFT_491026 [Aaosphaeria arxii CBS 175.79]